MAHRTDKQELSAGFGVPQPIDQDPHNERADYAIHSTNSILCLRLRATTCNENPLDNACNESAQSGQHGEQEDSSKPTDSLDNSFNNSAQSGNRDEQGDSSKPIVSLVDGESSDTTPHSLKDTRSNSYNAEGISFDDSGLGTSDDSKFTPIPSEMHCETVGTLSDSRLRQRKQKYMYVKDLGTGEECFPNTYRNYGSEDQCSDRKQSIPRAIYSLQTQTEQVEVQGEVQDWLKLMKKSFSVLLFVAAILALLYCCLFWSTVPQQRDKHAAKSTEIDAPVTRKHIVAVADELREWKKLARHLDVEEWQINRIDASNSGDEYEKGYQMLMYWKDKDENQATVQVLLTTLKQIHRRDIIEKLKEY